MVITGEYKFPPRPRIDTGESPLKVSEIPGVSPTLPINFIRKQYRHGTGTGYLETVDDTLPEGAERALQFLILQANSDFASHGIDIHLGLVKSGEGYKLDIYDCTDGHVCNLIKDNIIHIEELPVLIRNLQQEAGILLDTSA
ncbi:MAG: hypothetical protein H8E41_08855 [Desulfobulbaceae bacterium]|uniref:Uncharacterized protein n=1 Tax=Candidatus Desulfobia pelagia TaxID=2841692 RepID=A0A8J6NFX8_9BACT|nr:hypothetical protein [Candidatus Desulfobia pelagia]